MTLFFQPGYCLLPFCLSIFTKTLDMNYKKKFQHNCLCQVFGEKYVRLYPHDQSEFLYPYDTEDLLTNTSQIDIEEDFQAIIKKFPKFNQAKGFECILYPGDILYIPPKCWHFVKSLSKSCSLSFWF